MNQRVRTTAAAHFRPQLYRFSSRRQTATALSLNPVVNVFETLEVLA